MAMIPESAVVSSFLVGLIMTLSRLFQSGLIGNGDIGDKGRLAHRLSRKRRPLLKPGARRRCTPQRLPARVLQRPAQRLMVVIAGKVVAGVELESMAVGIPDIEKECVGNAVAAGAALDVLQVSAG